MAADPMWRCGHCQQLFSQSISATLHVASCRSPVTEDEINDAKDNLALLVAQLSGEGAENLRRVTFMRTRTHTEIYEGFMPVDAVPLAWFKEHKDSLTKKGEWFGDERIESVSP